MSDKTIEFLCGIILYELDCIKKSLLSSYSLVISDLLSLLTLKESLSRSGFYLNSLHNFFVLYLRIIDKLAISI